MKMAGYLFTFSDKDSLDKCMREGSYATLMSVSWNGAVAATLGDYATMQAGDSVYLFSNRMVYGIGEIIEIEDGVTVAENFPAATSSSKIDYHSANLDSITDEPIVTAGEKPKAKRWVIAFKPSPALFAKGVDMDDLLASNPKAFRSLRVFWKRSFIKLDDEEELAFRTAILRRNSEAIKNSGMSDTVVSDYRSTLKCYRERLRGKRPELGIAGLMREKRKKDGSLASEMLLEVATLWQLHRHDPRSEAVFGRWDYLSHQVPASPMKAVDYMDRMDIFGYRWIEGFKPIIGKYLVVELKKDVVSGTDIQQVMKYVDWCRNEYANGDYSLITAFLVGRHIDKASVRESIATAERNYVVGARPPESHVWDDLHFVEYEVRDSGDVEYRLVEIPGGDD